MVKNLSRQTLNSVSQLYLNGELEQHTTKPAIPPTFVTVLAKNRSGSNVLAGVPVVVYSFVVSNISYANALKYLRNNAPCFSFTSATSSSTQEAVCTTLEPIRSGKIGRIKSPCFELAKVSITDSDHTQVGTNYTTVASDGAFQIVAKSQTSDGYAICALSRIGGGIQTLPSLELYQDTTGVSYVSDVTFSGGIITITTSHLNIRYSS